jgi:hypothetical protein
MPGRHDLPKPLEKDTVFTINASRPTKNGPGSILGKNRLKSMKKNGYSGQIDRENTEAGVKITSISKVC